ncbi:hypothetical protein Glove_34g61 [Diversispora epigaea]|uniref:Uncharacterized protein n=1 Tax=Diversispora epigaea TaxID=1348612 RepID=A0A397JGJ8_9GLOM|nr:hypothetical protein Glove_34g61 [Diversispora epigaea]
MSDKELEGQVCRLLLKTIQKETITELIPNRVYVKAAQITKSKVLSATLRETEDRGNFIFDWDHNDLLGYLIQTSARLHRHLIPIYIRRDDHLRYSFQYARDLRNQNEYNLKSEFIKNIKTLLPGFENLFATDWTISEGEDRGGILQQQQGQGQGLGFGFGVGGGGGGILVGGVQGQVQGQAQGVQGQVQGQGDSGNLVFISNVGILAIVEVKHVVPSTGSSSQEIRRQIKEKTKRLKTEISRKSGLVTLGVMYTNEDEHSRLQFVNKIDRSIAFSVAEYTRRRAFKSMVIIGGILIYLVVYTEVNMVALLGLIVWSICLLVMAFLFLSCVRFNQP